MSIEEKKATAPGAAETSMQPNGIRLPLIHTAADIDALPHLSSEEKTLAKENLGKVAPSDGWFLLGHDPVGQAIWQLVELGIVKFIEPDSQAIPGSPMNVICFEVGRHIGCEWTNGLMAVITTAVQGMFKKPDWNHAKLALIAFPDAKAWTDQQRVSIKFARACLTNTMTDEVFNETREIFGEKKILRYILWIGYVHAWAMIQNACNLTYFSETKPSPSTMTSITPEQVGAIRQAMEDLWKSLWALCSDAMTTKQDSPATSPATETRSRLPIVRRDANVPPTGPWDLLGNDSEAYVFWRLIEQGLTKLLEPDFQGKPGGFMHLACLEVARHMACEWICSAMSAVASAGGDTWKNEDWNPAKLAMLEFPDSTLWTDEQSLILKFTRACLTNTMTDELFARALKQWGEKRLLRQMFWIGYVHIWAMMENACGTSYDRALDDPVTNISPEFFESFRPIIDKNWESLMELWASWRLPA